MKHFNISFRTIFSLCWLSYFHFINMWSIESLCAQSALFIIKRRNLSSTRLLPNCPTCSWWVSICKKVIPIFRQRSKRTNQSPSSLWQCWSYIYIMKLKKMTWDWRVLWCWEVHPRIALPTQGDLFHLDDTSRKTSILPHCHTPRTSLFLSSLRSCKLLYKDHCHSTRSSLPWNL